MFKRLMVVCILLACSGAARAADLDYSWLRSVPIQNGGRIKPLDTFARESVFQITGRESFEGHLPMELILKWLTDEKAAREDKVVEITHLGLKDAIGLPAGVRRFSVNELVANTKFQEMARGLTQKQQSGAELANLDKQAMRILEHISLLNSIGSGDAFTVVPNASEPRGAWLSLATVLSNPQIVSNGDRLLDDVRLLSKAFHDRDNEAFVRSSGHLRQDLLAVAPDAMPKPGAIERELQYNDLHPFGKAWMLYLAALLVLVAAGVLHKESGAMYWTGVGMTLAGLILHAYGIFLRCMIAGRPPVTNMYESVIWVSFGALVFAVILEATYRSRSLLLAANSAAIICLVLADNTGSILDPAINPLTPVLRSNFWLTIHVLTITLSYAAFMLTMAMGHIALWNYAYHPEERARLRSLHAQLYKSMQIGVLLLAAGTILGGVWANYSWGRFWGWDPKEVWALIALLGYLALLHGRFAGWLKNFGLAVGAVVAFLGVMMAWYGVNFVLGAGLHSYGFGDGGQQYVGAGVLADLGFVGAMVAKYRGWLRATAEPEDDSDE